MVRSLGYGIYHISADAGEEARGVAEQIGLVLEVWSDPEDPSSHTAILQSGFDTSRFEGSIATDPEVGPSVRRAVSCSPPGSMARERLRSVAGACAILFEGNYDASILEL